MGTADQVRNFCIIAHIDHGKSTLADRMLELTGTIEKRQMQEQFLDSLDIERERGITIKLTPVRMPYVLGAHSFALNLIDTPGHVDFNYEVSRSLAAVEGAVLLVDATQGIQAQTLGNLYLALEQNLTIIPAVNKIDLPAAEVEKTRAELQDLLGCAAEEILCISGKTGQGVGELLQAIVERVPSPVMKKTAVLRALIFDSLYDEYRGVVAYVRVVDGELCRGDQVELMAAQMRSEVLEVGYFTPKLTPCATLSAGEIGYIVTGLKDLSVCRVGDTLAGIKNLELGIKTQPLSGYKQVQPMVFAGLFPKTGDAYQKLREGLIKLKLNDAALTFEPEHSTALGFGFRAGFLGLLHLEIVEERLRREQGVEVITTVPSVAYRITQTNGDQRVVKGAQEFPDSNFLKFIEEPWVKIEIVTPKQYLGGIMPLLQEKHGVYQNTHYLGAGQEGRVVLHYELPLASILVDFYDKLKSVSSGYASLNYEWLDYRSADVVRLDILVAEEPVEALATIVYRADAQDCGRAIVEALKKTLPRQQFEVKIQAALGGKIIASERLAPFRKDVTGYLYGGDVTRKKKLLEKQKKGKKALRERSKGAVEIPPAAYLAVLKR